MRNAAQSGVPGGGMHGALDARYVCHLPGYDDSAFASDMGRPQPGTPMRPRGACRCGLRVCHGLTVVSSPSSSIIVVLAPRYGGFQATATDLPGHRIPRSPEAGRTVGAPDSSDCGVAA